MAFSASNPCGRLDNLTFFRHCDKWIWAIFSTSAEGGPQMVRDSKGNHPVNLHKLDAILSNLGLL